MRIRIKKLADGDRLSLPVEYEIEGELIGAVILGASVRVARDKRNGKPADGLFITSPVVNISADFPPSAGRFTTRNSVYEYEFIQA